MKMRSVSLSLLTFCLLAAVPALADTLYSTLPYNGNTNAHNLLSPWAVSDPILVPTNSDIETLTIVYWDSSSTDLLSTVQMAISSSALPVSGFETLTPTSSTIEGTNIHGLYVVEANFTFPIIDYSGAGWITLEHATCSSPCSILWDQNGATLNSKASNGGAPTSIDGESFSLGGEIAPEPSSLLLLGTGLLGMAGMLRRKLAR
jgi:hypothetical protein